MSTLVIAPAAALLSPGETVRLIAYRVAGDLSALAVPVIASWRSTDPLVLAVSDDGVVTARAPGQAQIVATFADATGMRSFDVSAEPPIVWGGKYVLESCTSACAPCCSRAGMAYAFNNELTLRYRVRGVNLIGVLGLGSFGPPLREMAVVGLIEGTHMVSLFGTFPPEGTLASTCCSGVVAWDTVIAPGGTMEGTFRVSGTQNFLTFIFRLSNVARR